MILVRRLTSFLQVSVVDELGIPVKFVGVGEGLEDLQPFDAEAFVNAIFSWELKVVSRHKLANSFIIFWINSVILLVTLLYADSLFDQTISFLAK